MNRLTAPSAVCAVALALLTGCSSDEPTEARPSAPAASVAAGSAPPTGPAASASAPAAGTGSALCGQVGAAKAALNEELKRVVSPDGTVPPAEGKKVLTGLATKLTDLAASADGELAKALDGLAAEATKAAKAADPVRAALGASFDAAGQRVDKACAKT
ncbi:hypothetical protein [Jidongwangia harbinensis]|uniref:hypothetical protein n=1 Tax=Jidongwangia harbinensis TaxID=2878561 RepID=UPI001CD96CB7|nr:hypothetical protein [Jidongwangia harbinensis]MCA2216559.1 hypothetical protein [Jidongwangia harbinensis]